MRGLPSGEASRARRARARATHPQLEPLTLGPSFGNSEAPAGSFEPSLRYQMIPKGSNFQDSCSTSPRHLVVGNVEKCWNPGKGGGWARASPPALPADGPINNPSPSRYTVVDGEPSAGRGRAGAPLSPRPQDPSPSRSRTEGLNLTAGMEMDGPCGRRGRARPTLTPLPATISCRQVVAVG